MNLVAFDPFEPFRYDFFERGVAVAVVTGALCGLVGVFVVLRSMSYIGHGLSHAVFGGAAVSAVMGASYFVGAGLWGVLAALLIGRVSSKRSVGADAAIGVVTTASFAIGLAIQSRSGEVSGALDAVLFGNVLGVFTRDLVVALLVGLVVTAFVVGYRRELTFVTFDREVAAVSGIAVARLDAVFMIALSATVLVSARVIGALLISAMLVLPAATHAPRDQLDHHHVVGVAPARSVVRRGRDVRQLVRRRAVGGRDHLDRHGPVRRRLAGVRRDATAGDRRHRRARSRLTARARR